MGALILITMVTYVYLLFILGIVLPAPASAELTGSIWRKRNLIPSSHYTSATSDFMRRKEMGHQERIFYKVQLGLKKTSKSLGLESRHQGIEKILGTKKPGGRGGRVRNRNPAPGRSRAREQPPPPAPENTGEDEDDPDDTQEDDYQNDSSGSETSLDESDLEVICQICPIGTQQLGGGIVNACKNEMIRH